MRGVLRAADVRGYTERESERTKRKRRKGFKILFAKYIKVGKGIHETESTKELSLSETSYSSIVDFL